MHENLNLVKINIYIHMVHYFTKNLQRLGLLNQDVTIFNITQPTRENPNPAWCPESQGIYSLSLSHGGHTQIGFKILSTFNVVS